MTELLQWKVLVEYVIVVWLLSQIARHRPQFRIVIALLILWGIHGVIFEVAIILRLRGTAFGGMSPASLNLWSSVVRDHMLTTVIGVGLYHEWLAMKSRRSKDDSHG